MEWDSSNEIIGYNSSWVPDTTMFNVPSGTKSLYVAKGYPSDRIIDPAVTRLDVTLSVSPVTCTVGDVVTVPVTVTDENSDPVTKGQVTITMGQDTYTGSVTSGTTNIQIPTSSMTSGTYTMNIAYTENDTYNAGTTTSTLTINKHTVQITVPDITGTVGDTVTLNITLTDENSNPVQGGTVQASVDGNTYTGSVTSGTTNIQIPTSSMTSGTYTVTTQYNGTTEYQSSTQTSSLTLEEPTPTPTWNTIDCTPTSTEWTKTPSSDGIHSTLNQYVTCNTQLPDNITLRIHGTSTSTQGGIELRDLATSNKSSLTWNNHNGVRKWGQIGTGQASPLTWNTGEFTLEITKNNGVFTFDLNGSTGTFNLNSQLLNTCYLAFYVNNGEIVIDSVKWKQNE